MNKKLKSLALILRSLPPLAQRSIYEQLPLETVEKINQVQPDVEEELSQEDWDFFTNTWPELASVVSSAVDESKLQEINNSMITERHKVREYIEYKIGQRQDRPKLSNSISKIVDKYVGV